MKNSFPGFRGKETRQIFRRVSAGDSCAVAGVSGSGKSNLFRHLATPFGRELLEGISGGVSVLASVDANALGEFSERAMQDILLASILSGLEELDAPRDLTGTVKALRAESSSADALNRPALLSRAISAILATSPYQRVVILLDQFDVIASHLSPIFFANLRALRDQHKHRLCYVVFAREELVSVLPSDPRCHEFSELFSGETLWLGWYSRSDAETLINRVARRYGVSVPASVTKRLLQLTGRHAGCLKAVLSSLLRAGGRAALGRMVNATSLAAFAAVAEECRSLLEGLPPSERAALEAFAGSKSPKRVPLKDAERLIMKGLLEGSPDSARLTIALLHNYITGTAGDASGPRTHDLRIDEIGDVYLGDQRMAPPLTPKELKLLQSLCSAPSKFRTRDDLTAAVYNASQSMVTEDALIAIVRRLRQRLKAFTYQKEPILAVRGRGYRLNL